ncbi:hypothetical protein [Rubinisphaera italica]|nr:hypothetical protein [Rubinisphaera italica]
MLHPSLLMSIEQQIYRRYPSRRPMRPGHRRQSPGGCHRTLFPEELEASEPDVTLTDMSDAARVAELLLG